MGQARQTAHIRAELEVSWASLGELRREWPELAERSGNIFATWEFAHAWREHLGPDHTALVAACRWPDGSLAAIVPLYVDRRRALRVLRFMGAGPGDTLGPICDAGTPSIGGQALTLALQAAGRKWDVLLAEHLPAHLRWDAAVGGTMLARDAFPVLRFRQRTWEQFLAERSANFRGQVRRRERRLMAEHELSYRLSTDHAQLEHDLDTLIRLHRARWGSGGSGAFDGAREAFHRAFARAALERGWLRLWMLELDGRTVASWYGFRYGGAESYYQAGRDPVWESRSVGFVLLAHTVRAALEDGASEYRFLRGAERYKARFAEEDAGLETFAAARGVRGRAALTGARVALGLPAPWRSRFTALAR